MLPQEVKNMANLGKLFVFHGSQGKQKKNIGFVNFKCLVLQKNFCCCLLGKIYFL